jgi:hypothetical protein
MSRSRLTKITPAIFDEILRRDFRAFIHRVVQQLSPGTPYQPNWHIDAAAYQLERVRNGELTRLIINMPPRSLKSVVTSVAFPAFLLGHDPRMRIICVSYGADLAAKHARDFREIITSTWYRRLFPDTRISPTKNTEAEIETTAGGFRLSTSTEGTLTGRGGGLIIIDDPLKPIDALSDSRRERANEWFRNTLLSRLDDKVHDSIVIVMQRVHLDDLTGNRRTNGRSSSSRPWPRNGRWSGPAMASATFSFARSATRSILSASRLRHSKSSELSSARILSQRSTNSSRYLPAALW